ncbi:MAG: hypothetical protein QM758_18945 [Armatimonas sp.]
MSEKVRQTQTLSNLKQIGVATIHYVQEHEEFLPPMRSLQEFQFAIDKPKEESLWKSPGWNLPYRTNSQLSQKQLTKLDDLSQLAILYEPAPLWKFGEDANQTLRGVAFADGHAKLVKQSEWENIRKLSHIDKDAAPYIAPWWNIFTTGPREPLSDSRAAQLWGAGYLFFSLLAAVLRRKNVLIGTAIYLLSGGVLGILGFMLLVNLGRVGFIP